MYNSEFGPIDN